MSFIIIALIALICVLQVNSAQYTVKTSGNPTDLPNPPVGLSVSYLNRNSNSLTWHRYLDPQMFRLFISPNDGKWNTSLSSFYGRSFFDISVDTIDAWEQAVAGLRQISKYPTDPEFLGWLASSNVTAFGNSLRKLSTTGSTPYSSQQGSAVDALQGLFDYNTAFPGLKDNIIVVWDVRCRNLPYTTTNTSDPEYWRQRWETYRIFYFGGRWLAAKGFQGSIELYNEPDRDACMTPQYWVDDVRIRSQAIKEAYSDYNSWSGRNFELPSLLAPGLSQTWVASLGEPTFQVLTTPFPRNNSDGTRMFDVYSYHRYGGFTQQNCTELSASCRHYDGQVLSKSFKQILQSYANSSAVPGEYFPTAITELNCYPNAVADSTLSYFKNIHVIDLSDTASCLSAMIANIMTNSETFFKPKFLIIFKSIQTLRSGSRVVKNGLLFASNFEPPYDVSGSSKTAEAYRLIARKQGVLRSILNWNFTISPDTQNAAVNAVIVDDHGAYYVYLTNDQYLPNSFQLELSTLPNIQKSTTTVTSAVGNWPNGTSAHGEVIAIDPVSSPNMNVTLPKGSMFMITIPKLPITVTETIASDAVVVYAGDKSAQNFAKQPLTVATSTTSAIDTSVALFKFDPASKVANLTNIVWAVLQLNLKSSQGVTDPQILTVLAFDQDWTEGSITWSTSTILKQLTTGVDKTSANFVRWGFNFNPRVAGFVTVSPGVSGDTLQLDVTDLVRTGAKSYAVLRMFRYDNSSSGPADPVQGSYTFDGLDVEQDAPKPKIIIADAQTTVANVFPNAATTAFPPYAPTSSSKLNATVLVAAVLLFWSLRFNL